MMLCNTSHQNRLSQHDLPHIIHTAPVGMIVSHLDGSFAYANPALMNMLGYDEDEIYNPNIIVSHPDDYDINRNIRQQLIDNPKEIVVTEKRYLHKSGRTITGLVSIASLFNQQNNHQYLVAQIVNIGRQKRFETSVNLFRSMINSSQEIMLVLEPKTGKILDCNMQGCSHLGYCYDEILSLTIIDIDTQLAKPNIWQDTLTALNKKNSLTLEGKHHRKDNTSFPVDMSMSYITFDNTNYIIILSKDISERKQSEKLIWQQANYDLLTKLPNRNMLYKELKELINHCSHKRKKFSVILLDLDKFKDINDTLGHYVGDQLLMAVAQRISKHLDQHGVAYRLGGDEFCIILREKRQKTTQHLAELLIKKLSEPFLLGQHTIFMSASIGVSQFPSDTIEADDLLKYSDQAMYCAKDKGRNCIHYFSSTMHQQALQKMQLSRDLHHALPEHQFHIEYQAICAMGDKSIQKAEALLRWRHPSKGLVNPEEFISLAEGNGTIDTIGHWIFQQVLQQLLQWKKRYGTTFQISINASPIYFREGNKLLQQWQHKLNSAGLPGDAIVIEITEGLLLETSSHVTDKLLMLRDAKIQVALDDFGTGYSSLAYLNKLDIDYLKIDKSFINHLSAHSNEEALCEAIIVMAHKLKLQVIAEGIETENQYHLLQAMGCDYGQGFYLSKPLRAHQFEQHFTPVLQDDQIHPS